MAIRGLDYALLLYLQQKPMENIATIAKELGLSYYMTKKTYEGLYREGLIKGVAAILSPAALKLKKITAFFEVNKYNKLKKVERIIDAHNYSRYRARYISGSRKGVYANFEIPEKTTRYMKELCEEMKEKKVIEKYKIYRREEKEIRTKIDLRYINLNTMEWKFNIDEWLEKVEKAEGKEERKKGEENKKRNIRLNEIDLWIMRAISNNAQMGVKEIRKKIEDETRQLIGKPIEKDLSTISRRLKKIKNEYILEYQLLVNNNMFDLHSNVIIEVKENEGLTKKLEEKLKHDPIPFKSIFNKTENGFQWYVRCPMEHTMKITNYLWKKDVKNMEIIQIIKPTRLYYFYPFNYDVKKQKWKEDKEYFFEPIKRILEEE